MARWLLKIFFVLGLALLYTGSRIKVIELGYEASQLKTTVAEMKRTNSLLKSKVASGRSTTRLSTWAKRLGLHSPLEGEVLFIEE